MRDKRNLNVGNTFRSWNLNLVFPIGHQYPILPIKGYNYSKIRKQINQGNTDKYTYILDFSEKGLGYDDKLNSDLLKKNPHFIYRVKDRVPSYLPILMNRNKNGIIQFPYKSNYDVDMLRDCSRCDMICRTSVLCKLKYGEETPTDILLSLWDMRYILREFYLYFIPLDDISDIPNGDSIYNYDKNDKKYHIQSYYKLQYYYSIHEALARWRIQLYIVCESNSEMIYIKDQANKALN